MKAWISVLLLTGLLMGPIAVKVYALDSAEQMTQEVSDKLDEQGKQEPQKVQDSLVREYNVTGGQIANLRGQGLGFGDINIVLGLAQQMKGGVNDQNIQTVVSTRQSQPGMGWGNIAKSLNLDLQSVADKMGGIENPRGMIDVSQQDSTRKDLDRTQTEQKGGMAGSGSSY